MRMIIKHTYTMDADGNLNVMLLIALVLAGMYRARRQPRPQHNSVLTGDLYFREIMATENVNRFREVARMDKETFDLLKDNLIDGGLRDSMYICSGQKLLCIFCCTFSVDTQTEKLPSDGNTLVQLYLR